MAEAGIILEFLHSRVLIPDFRKVKTSIVRASCAPFSLYVWPLPMFSPGWELEGSWIFYMLTECSKGTWPKGNSQARKTSYHFWYGLLVEAVTTAHPSSKGEEKA